MKGEDKIIVVFTKFSTFIINSSASFCVVLSLLLCYDFVDLVEYLSRRFVKSKHSY